MRCGFAIVVLVTRMLHLSQVKSQMRVVAVIAIGDRTSKLCRTWRYSCRVRGLAHLAGHVLRFASSHARMLHQGPRRP